MSVRLRRHVPPGGALRALLALAACAFVVSLVVALGELAIDLAERETLAARLRRLSPEEQEDVLMRRRTAPDVPRRAGPSARSGLSSVEALLK